MNGYWVRFRRWLRRTELHVQLDYLAILLEAGERNNILRMKKMSEDFKGLEDTVDALAPAIANLRATVTDLATAVLALRADVGASDRQVDIDRIKAKAAVALKSVQDADAEGEVVVPPAPAPEPVPVPVPVTSEPVPGGDDAGDDVPVGVGSAPVPAAVGVLP